MAKIKNMMMPDKSKSMMDDMMGESENQPKVKLKEMLSKKRPRKPRKMQ